MAVYKDEGAERTDTALSAYERYFLETRQAENSGVQAWQLAQYDGVSKGENNRNR